MAYQVGVGRGLAELGEDVGMCRSIRLGSSGLCLGVVSVGESQDQHCTVSESQLFGLCQKRWCSLQTCCVQALHL